MLVAMLCHQQLTAHVCYSRCMRNRKAVLKNILRQSVWALFVRFTFSCFSRHLDLLLVNTHFGQLKKHPEFYIIFKNLVSKKWDGCCFVLVTSDPKPVGSRMKKLTHLLPHLLAKQPAILRMLQVSLKMGIFKNGFSAWGKCWGHPLFKSRKAVELPTRTLPVKVRSTGYLWVKSDRLGIFTQLVAPRCGHGPEPP